MNVGREKIEYFTNRGAADKSETPSGTIDLMNFKGVKKFDDLTFQLDGGSDGVFLLRADSNAEMNMWINSLEVYLRDKMVSCCIKFVFWSEHFCAYSQIKDEYCATNNMAYGNFYKVFFSYLRIISER